jgi:hypothetical protein
MQQPQVEGLTATWSKAEDGANCVVLTCVHEDKWQPDMVEAVGLRCCNDCMWKWGMQSTELWGDPELQKSIAAAIR